MIISNYVCMVQSPSFIREKTHQEHKGAALTWYTLYNKNLKQELYLPYLNMLIYNKI